MNARAYFQILRPGRTLFATLIAGVYVYIFVVTVLHAATSERLLFGLAIIGPVVVGRLLVGPLHEVMHRSFFPTLPDARSIFRRWHLCAVTAASVVFFVLSALFVTNIPRPALYGLIMAGLSMPAFDSQRSRPVMLRLTFSMLLLPILIMLVSMHSAVVAICQQAPWAVLVGGLSFSYACFRKGFSAQNVCECWRDPNFYCTQSTMVFIGTDILLHAQAETRQLAQQRSSGNGHDWSVASVGTSLSDWLRVVHHARFGRTSRLIQYVRLVLGGACIVPLGLFFIFAAEKGTGKSVAQLARLFLEVGKTGSTLAHPELLLFFILSPLAACGLAWLAGTMASIPACPFPLARQRLATCLYVDACIRAASVFVTIGVTTALCIYVISHIAGVPFEPAVLRVSLAAFAMQPPAIALWIGCNFLRHAGTRFLAGIVLGLGFFTVTINVILSCTAKVASPLGLLTCVAATGLAGWLSWLMFQRYYRTCDLNHTGAWLQKLGIGLG